MMWRSSIPAILALSLLSGCNTWQRYQASVEQGCREQANGKPARYEDCMRKAAARDRERLRHQDQEWLDSLDNASQFPVIYVAPRQPGWHR